MALARIALWARDGAAVDRPQSQQHARQTSLAASTGTDNQQVLAVDDLQRLTAP